MRKHFFLLLLLPFSSYAQVNSVGIKAGMVFSLPQDFYQTDFGYDYGLIYRRFLTERISLIAEPSFMRTGKSYLIEFEDLPDAVREHYHYSYIHVPVLVSYQYPLPLLDSFIGVQTGFSPMFLTNARHRQLEIDVQDDLQNFTLNYLIGLSGHYMMDPLEFGLTVRYGFNLGGTYAEEAYRINLLNFLFTAAYRF
ncbi:outer membrane beta-barrel protein [Cytophagaceae bacterium ABcell3]|nr:outer membrane beta-barrel protein [Cytophagaceae bacterium ABcell3]